MKKILFSLIAFTVTTQLTAQTKIGGTPGPAQSGAFLELDGSAANKGLLLSRYNTAQMNAIPVTASSNGMLVYNTDSNCVCQYKGTTLGWRSMCNNLKGTTCLPEIINTTTASTPLTVPNTFVNLGTINYTATDTTTLLVHWTGSVGYTGYNVDGMNVPMRILMNGTQIASTYFDDASTFVVDDAGSVQVAVKLNPGTYAFVLQAARGGANSGTAQIRPSVFQAIAFPACGGGLTVNEAGGIFWKLTGNAGTDSATNFIGTTDAKPLILKTNSQPRMVVGSNGNVGVGTTTTHAGSILELESTNKGFRMPQINLSDTKTWSLSGAGTDAATSGMMVYNTNAGITNLTSDINYPAIGKGQYYWDGAGWVGNNPTATLLIKALVQGYFTGSYANTYFGNISATESYDRTNSFAGNTFTAPRTGIYTVSFAASTNGSTGVVLGGTWELQVVPSVSSSFVTRYISPAASGSIILSGNGSVAISLNAGETMTFKLYNGSGATQALAASSYNKFSIAEN